MFDFSKLKFLQAPEKERLFQVIENDTSIHSLRNKAIFYLAEYAGLRASEIGLIQESDFILYNKEIYCRRLKKSNNNTLRIIDSNVFNALVDHISHKVDIYGQTPHMFPSQKQNPISRKTLDTMIKRYCLLAEIPSDKAHFHVLKHTRAITLADLGVDIRDIQYWLGHKSIKSTELYLQYTSKQQDRLYKNLEYLMEKEKQQQYNLENLH